MSWRSHYRRKPAPNAPDEEGISISDAVDRIFYYIIRSLGDEDGDLAAEITVEVATGLYLKWQAEAKNPPAGITAKPKVAKHHQIPTNRALDIDLAVFKEIEPYKITWIDDAGRPLDTETVDQWYLEDTINYLLKRHSLYVGVGVGNSVFTYQNTVVQGVLEALNPALLETESLTKDSEFRRAKEFIIEHYFKKNRKGDFKRSVGRFLKTAPRPARKNEVRFVARPISDEEFKFVKATLWHLTPLRPDCPFPIDFYKDKMSVPPESFNQFLIDRDVYKTPDGLDRVLMHTLLDPECWFRVYRQMTPDPPERMLEMPQYTDPRINPNARPPINRNNPPPLLTTKLKKSILWRLNKKVSQHNKFSATSVELIVDNEVHCSFDLDRTRTIQRALVLEDDENIIKIWGRNEGGRALLGMHILPWSKYQVGDGSLKYTTNLKGGHRLELLVTYKVDEFGNPVGAVIDVTHTLVPQSSALTHLGRRFGNKISPALPELAAAAVIGFATTLLIRVFTYPKLWRHIAGVAVIACIPLIAALGLRGTAYQAYLSGLLPWVSGRTSKLIANDRMMGTGDAKSSALHAPAPYGWVSIGPKVADARSAHVIKVRTLPPSDETSQGKVEYHPRRALRSLQSERARLRMRNGRALASQHVSPLALTRNGGDPPNVPDVGSLVGIITNTNKETLPQTKITLKPVSGNRVISLLSNEKGNYRLCQIGAGLYDYIVEKDGFIPVNGQILIQRVVRTRIDFELKTSKLGAKTFLHPQTPFVNSSCACNAKN